MCGEESATGPETRGRERRHLQLSTFNVQRRSAVDQQPTTSNQQLPFPVPRSFDIFTRRGGPHPSFGIAFPTIQSILWILSEALLDFNDFNAFNAFNDFNALNAFNALNDFNAFNAFNDFNDFNDFNALNDFNDLSRPLTTNN